MGHPVFPLPFDGHSHASVWPAFDKAWQERQNNPLRNCAHPWGCSSVGEHHVRNVGAVGSNPIISTTEFPQVTRGFPGWPALVSGALFGASAENSPKIKNGLSRKFPRNPMCGHREAAGRPPGSGACLAFFLSSLNPPLLLRLSWFFECCLNPSRELRTFRALFSALGPLGGRQGKMWRQKQSKENGRGPARPSFVFVRPASLSRLRREMPSTLHDEKEEKGGRGPDGACERRGAGRPARRRLRRPGGEKA